MGFAPMRYPPGSAPSDCRRSRKGDIHADNRAVAPPMPHVNDAADDAPIVVPLRPRQPRRQMRFDARPLLVIQPKQTLTHFLVPNQPHGSKNHVLLIRYRPEHVHEQLLNGGGQHGKFILPYSHDLINRKPVESRHIRIGAHILEFNPIAFAQIAWQ